MQPETLVHVRPDGFAAGKNETFSYSKQVSLETESHLQEMYDCAYEDAFFRAWDDPARVPHAHDTSAYLKLNFRLRLVRKAAIWGFFFCVWAGKLSLSFRLEKFFTLNHEHPMASVVTFALKL